MAASIQEFGWRQPIVAEPEPNLGVIVCGHLRLLAAQKLGLAEVPVHVAVGLTAAQIKAYRLMDNRSHQETDWDEELLGIELAELKDLAVDLTLTGFDANELDKLLLPAASAEEDAVPEVPAEPVSRLGDLWLCGAHRVMCGDSTDAAMVAILLGGQKAPFLMATDPPYGVEYDPEWRQEAADKGLIGFHPSAMGKVRNDGKVDWAAALLHFPGNVAYVWHAGVTAAEVAIGLHGINFEIRSQIVWGKQSFAISRGHYHWQHEPCWYAVRKGLSAHWHGDRSQSTLWSIPVLNADEKRTGHSTQKPVELFRRPILNHTAPGEAIFDPFLGSGTAIIAAELTGRTCYGLEISEQYTDVIAQRWMNQTGKQATLDGDGRTFAQVAESRVGAAIEEPVAV